MTRNILFLCSRNRLRSPTAEAVFRGWPGVETDSAGLAADAEVPLEADQLRWADLVVVMEKRHVTQLRRRYARQLGSVRVVCLDIPDRYTFMQPELVDLLTRRMRPHLPAE